MQEALFSAAIWMGFVIPALALVYEVASGKLLNVSKSHFSLFKINGIGQEGLFLRLRIIIYVIYVCIDIGVHIYLFS